jgi:predicted ArsR family transcriptional regulator
MTKDVAAERRTSLTRQVNSQRVMEAIMRDGPITRAALARELDLSKPTISDIVKTLDEAGWIESVGAQRNGMGRAGTEYALRQRAAHVIGVDIGGANVRAAIADLTGEILLERVVPTESDSLKSLTAQVSELCHVLARESQSRWRTVEAVAIGPRASSTRPPASWA